MAAPRVGKHLIAAALAAVASGASMADAAAAHGVGVATLRRYRHGYASPAKGDGARGAAKPAKAATTPSRARRRAKEEPPSSPPTEVDEGEAAALVLLRRELAHACRRRAAATKAGNEALDARWSTRIEALAKVVERLEPPPPVREDEVLQRLRDADGEMLAMIEMHVSNPIAAAEIGPRIADLHRFADRLPPELGAELRNMLRPVEGTAKGK